MPLSLLLAAAALAVDPPVAGGAHLPPPDREAMDPGITGPEDPPPHRVVGGSPADPGLWPDVAGVYIGDRVLCTGVLVAPDAVLTAAHCGWSPAVVLGTTDHARGGEVIEVMERIVHPDEWTTYDVALLRLARPSAVAPRPLAVDCLAQDYLTDGAPVAIVGYGATDRWASEWDSTLREAWTTIRDHDCSDLSAGCNEAVSPGGELIAGGDGVDSCNGDSGGPLFLSTPEGEWLAGITSRAATPATAPCGDGGIYVRVDAVVDWIEAELGRPVVRPDCEGMNRAPFASAEPLAVAPGHAVVARVIVDDPNLGDAHRFTIVEPAEHGLGLVAPDGMILYTASPTLTDADRFVVRVEDDGQPPLSVDVEILVTAEEPAPTGGCATAPAAAGWLALPALLLARRRSGRVRG